MTPAFRIHLAAFLFLLLMVGGAGRLIYIEMSEKDFLQDQGDARTIRMERINAHRGMILDRRDNPLAVSSPVVFKIRVMPEPFEWSGSMPIAA